MIRFIASALYLLLYLIITLPLELILYIIGKFNMPLRDKIGMACVKYGGFGVVTKLSGAKVIVNGLENIPDDTACLFVGNHNSFFDVIITRLYCHLYHKSIHDGHQLRLGDACA